MVVVAEEKVFGSFYVVGDLVVSSGFRYCGALLLYRYFGVDEGGFGFGRGPREAICLGSSNI